jgi:hypothetical protein
MSGKSRTSVKEAMTDMRESVRMAHKGLSQSVMGPAKDPDKQFFEGLSDDDLGRLRRVFGEAEVDRYIQAMTGG